ncbi:TPA: hypothetical protein U6I39_003176 [Klebsiella pneumoniae]|nr:hypothetical protein [Klebsiella pneumoniae]HEO1547786.1 hypothetical protein [Klebsiella aerogenes]ELA0032307.1 hypothetical protein [Klebsiella pneumoniae]MEA1129716.1 hypothetical protein [Klebsiella pneumoniae]PCR12680.1 hypothetical protein CQA67_21205 [Klebsiella pneumoniae]SWU79719.1 Uncharacterised protein [Klebsiella pneumoniae]
MSLPNRLYYPIELAANKLSCSVSDLIHYGATSDIEICLHMSFNCAECFFEYDTSSELIDFTKGRKIYVKGKYNSFNLRRNDDGIYLNDFYGLAALTSQDLLTIDFEPEASISINQVFCPAGNGKFFDDIIGAVYIEPNEDYVAQTSKDKVIERLFITDYEIKRLLDDAEFHDTPSLPEIKKRNSSKTLNSQAKFIKSLLWIHYGEDVANNPRQHLEAKSSGSGVILSDFETYGLKAPSGVTVDGWLKFIDVEKTSEAD